MHPFFSKDQFAQKYQPIFEGRNLCRHHQNALEDLEDIVGRIRGSSNFLENTDLTTIQEVRKDLSATIKSTTEVKELADHVLQQIIHRQDTTDSEIAATSEAMSELDDFIDLICPEIRSAFSKERSKLLEQYTDLVNKHQEVCELNQKQAAEITAFHISTRNPSSTKGPTIEDFLDEIRRSQTSGLKTGIETANTNLKIAELTITKQDKELDTLRSYKSQYDQATKQVTAVSNMLDFYMKELDKATKRNEFLEHENNNQKLRISRLQQENDEQSSTILARAATIETLSNAAEEWKKELYQLTEMSKKEIIGYNEIIQLKLQVKYLNEHVESTTRLNTRLSVEAGEDVNSLDLSIINEDAGIPQTPQTPFTPSETTSIANSGSYIQTPDTGNSSHIGTKTVNFGGSPRSKVTFQPLKIGNTIETLAETVPHSSASDIMNSIESDSSSTLKRTDQNAIEKIQFLVCGTPKEGDKIKSTDVHDDLLKLLESTIAGWRGSARQRAWYSSSHVMKCVDVRLKGYNARKAPPHQDPEHKTACTTCIKGGRLCMIIQFKSSPVILPLPEEKRLSGASSKELGYYVMSK